MERVIKERMSIRDQDQVSPVNLINIRPVVAALARVLWLQPAIPIHGSNQSSGRTAPQAHAFCLGPGGLRRERAGFDVRDVHYSHYGRICPIETPEGPNIGLIGRLANFARVNEYGFIETPYRRVYHILPSDDPRLDNRKVTTNLVDPETGEIIVKKDERLVGEKLKAVKKLKSSALILCPLSRQKYEYLSADAEDKYMIAQANSVLNDNDEFENDSVSCRFTPISLISRTETVEFMDVAPHQMVGVSAALIPFLEHDDANRALMGSNMQAQAVPLVQPQIPTISTGMEAFAAIDSGQVLVAEEEW